MIRITAALTLAVALAAWPARSGVQATDQPQIPQAPVFRAGTDAVTVDVSVQDGLKVVANLGASDFAVLDDGVPQDVTTVSYGKLPIDVTVALDVSSSERGAPLARLQRGVVQLTSDLATNDRLRLIAFNHDVRRVLDFDTDPKIVEAAIGGLAAGGGTSIFDALSVSMLTATDPTRRRFVTLFTDGSDGLSVTEPRVLLEAARRSQASVTAVVPRSAAIASGLAGPLGVVIPPGSRLTITPRRVDPLLHEQVSLIGDLATITGGRVIVDPGPPLDLGASFRRALDTFRSSYVLYFTPRNADHAGFHTLTVSVPGHTNYTIRARTGYFKN